MIFGVHPLIALGVLASTAATDAAYVFFNAAVSGRRRVWAANWSAIWYLLSAFAVISYTENAIYVLFAATGSWLGAFVSVTWLRREHTEAVQTRHNPLNHDRAVSGARSSRAQRWISRSSGSALSTM